MTLSQRHTGQGFMRNMTIRRPHKSSDGNASIFRGLSHVPAFFRDLERYLTLKARSLGISVWARVCVQVNTSHVVGVRGRKRMREKRGGERGYNLSAGAHKAFGTSI